MFTARTGRRPRLPVATVNPWLRRARIYSVLLTAKRLGEAVVLAALFTAPAWASLFLD